VTRRLAIGGGAALVLGGVAYGGSRAACTLRDRRAAAALVAPERLFAAIPAIRDAAAVGRAVLRGEAEMAPGDVLPGLAASPGMRAACGLTCDRARAGALRRAFRAEMAGGAHVLAAGWVISPSEARIAALWLAAGAPPPSARG
jgi:hypothetical protein